MRTLIGMKTDLPILISSAITELSVRNTLRNDYTGTNKTQLTLLSPYLFYGLAWDL